MAVSQATPSLKSNRKVAITAGLDSRIFIMNVQKISLDADMEEHKGSITMKQKDYAEDVIARFDVKDCNQGARCLCTQCFIACRNVASVRLIDVHFY